MGYNKLFYKDKSIFGLDISQTGIKAMSVSPKGWSVRGYGNCNLDPVQLNESLEKGDDFLANGIATLLGKNIVGDIATNRVVLGLPTVRTFNRSVSIPIEAKKSLKNSVELEAEQYIPIPVSELYLDYQVISETETDIEVLFCAIPRLIVDNTIKSCEKAGLEVAMVEPSMNAVARLIQRSDEGDLPTVIVDIGAASTDIAVLNKAVRVTGSIGVGGNSFTLDIANTLNVPLENAHQLKVLSGLAAGPKQAKIVEALRPNLKRIATEVRKVIRYYTERIGSSEKIEQLIVVGGGSNVPGIGEFFTNEMILPARVASPWQALDFANLEQPSRQFKPRYLTAAGLASVREKEILR